VLGVVAVVAVVAIPVVVVVVVVVGAINGGLRKNCRYSCCSGFPPTATTINAIAKQKKRMARALF
jgi:hypothetical protein